jgi:hypothetical protein
VISTGSLSAVGVAAGVGEDPFEVGPVEVRATPGSDGRSEIEELPERAGGDEGPISPPTNIDPADQT